MIFRRRRRAWVWYALGSLVMGLVMFGVAALFHAAVSREPRPKTAKPRRRIAAGLIEKAVNWLTRSSE